MNYLGNMQNLIANTLLVFSLVWFLFHNSIVTVLVVLDGSLKIYFDSIWAVKMVVNHKCVLFNF